ncbi:P-loop containing nucleoside triphosphate hydrolase protein [Diplogelasinospora grovesii]|uniref:ATP-dependent RNA helicase ROK1 n=1 Tax=Diplogelasinospora grovesii TaxID=303347 RepID=A0AAN6N5R9_9PEZI|nr:P-loop containing nucleoside triphosphate hydrolase protein [Diplogelasinospora grovesii]
MDILKVLSRGIKPTGKKTGGPSAAAALPSAGSKPNPQFFHDKVGGSSSKGKKRKRSKKDQGDNHGEDEEEEVSDVDFFAPKTDEHSEKPAETKGDGEGGGDGKVEEQPKKKAKKLLLDEEECKRILRSHRLKLSILSGQQKEEKAEPKKKKAKKDKKSREEPAETKEDKKPELVNPQPLTSFRDLRDIYDIAPQVADNITRQGFRQPSEVQMASLPLLLDAKTALKKADANGHISAEGGVDFMAVAPTGSGKTISFLIPAIDGIIRRRGEKTDEHVLDAIIVAPTRELASQIVNEGRKLALGTGVRVVLMKRTLPLSAHEDKRETEDDDGDDSDADGNEDDEEGKNAEEPEASEDESDSEAEQTKGEGSEKPKPPARVDILVTTPKILLNFLSGGTKPVTLKKSLPTVRSLILDEADVLLDPIFKKQTIGIWRACTNADLRMSFWSATMASNIETIITKQLDKMSKRMEIQPKPLIRLVVGLKDTAVPSVSHRLIYTATEPGKLLALRQLLHPVKESGAAEEPLRPPFLVFTQTIERAQALHDELKYDIPVEAGGSARIAVLHSSLSDSVRSKIMARFRSGEIWVLVTTDVLARGVDFAGVNGVVNYDVPNSAAAYVHRVGRTGRAGREGGIAVTFYTKDDVPFVKSVANVIAASERQAGSNKVEGGGSSSTVQKWLLDALPKVAKEDRRKLKVRGVESRRTGGKATITTKSAWERKRENNRRGAIEGSKRRKKLEQQKQKEGGGDGDGEFGGFDD